jgi:hypothetical protein
MEGPRAHAIPGHVRIFAAKTLAGIERLPIRPQLVDVALSAKMIPNIFNREIKRAGSRSRR